MSPRRYATPLAFKQALEQRLRTSSTSGIDFARRRQLLVFDRFLARVTRVAGDAVILKGGLVLELRLSRARTTKDVDLRMMGSSDDVLERLQAAGRLDLGDYMLFEVQPDSDHPEIRTEAMRLALERTFEFRGTHPLPASVPAPPEFWQEPYAAMASSDDLIWPSLGEVTQAASEFLDPVLASAECGIWEPKDWRWSAHDTDAAST